MREGSMSYAGKCAGCGAVVALTVDRPEYRKWVAKDIAEWINDGLIVERMTSEQGLASFGNGCTCLRAPETLPLFETV